MYTKRVPFLSKMVYKRARVWTSPYKILFCRAECVETTQRYVESLITPYLELFCSNCHWGISGLLSTNGRGILGIHIRWRDNESLVSKDFGSFNVPHFFEHGSQSDDLLSSEL